MSHRRLILSVALTVLVGASSLPGLAASAADRPVAVRGILRGDLGPATGSPIPAARAALTANARALDVDPADFRFESVRRSMVGIHVRGREFRGDVPVDATSVAVHMVGGRVWQVEARPSSLPGSPSAEVISSSAARSLGLAALKITRPAVPPRTERSLTAIDGRLRDVWQVHGFSLRPARTGTAVLDAATGALIEIRDERRFIDGSATVFDPNPVVTSRDPSMREDGIDQQGLDTDLDSPELARELRTRPLRQLDDSALPLGRLSGPWVDVQAPLPFTGSQLQMTRSDPRFEATMAYAHLDRLQRYLQDTLGFKGAAGVNAEPQQVFALIIPGFDNSFYQQGDDFMVLGSGGVDDGEDAEVIVHEYGHAIHDAQVPGWGSNHEGGSMGEGWGDFLAASYYARTSGGFSDACIAEWDSTSYASEEEPCLRRTDSTKHYPQNLDDPEDPNNGDVHADGEIWSAFLWRIRGMLACLPHEKACARWPANRRSIQASDRVLKLVLTSHEFLTTNADFGDAVAALMTAAKALKQRTWIPLIQRAARERGLPLS
jgi:hypothetical protein